MRVDSKIFNDKIRRYVGDQIWVDFHREWIQPDQRYLGLAVIPPRGPVLGHFRDDAPLVDGAREFRKGDSAMRVGDSSMVLSHDEAASHQASISTGPVIGSPFAIDLPYFRILALETQDFIRRDVLGTQIERALVDPRTSVTSLIGIGGSGKTTLATWAALRAYENKRFNFIVSLTAKDRELGTMGIQSLSTGPTTFEVLLNTVLEVLGFTELAEAPVDEREADVRGLLESSNGLLYVDNLETVDDPRVIAFLDDLPLGVRALVTSRRATVRVAVRPVDVGPLSIKDAPSCCLCVAIRALAMSPTFLSRRLTRSPRPATGFLSQSAGHLRGQAARLRRFIELMHLAHLVTATRASYLNSCSAGSLTI